MLVNKMKKLFRIGNKDIFDVHTTILIDSSYNYSKEIAEYLNNECIVIKKDSYLTPYGISNDLYKYFECEYLQNKTILTKIDEIKLNILSNLSNANKVYVFFNILTYLDEGFKIKLIKYLSSLNKIIINYTSDIEETLLLDYLIVIYNNEVIMEGQKELVLKEEKILKKLGFGLPFIVELSSGLKYYGLIDKIYYNNESLVDALWK